MSGPMSSMYVKYVLKRDIRNGSLVSAPFTTHPVMLSLLYVFPIITYIVSYDLQRSFLIESG